MASPPFKVKAVYEYASEHGDDLQFPIGQIITVTELEGDDWYVGEYSDVTGVKKEGLFPMNFVEKYEPEIPSRPSRPSRPKQEVQSPTATSTQTAPPELEEEVPPQPPVESKPSAFEQRGIVGTEKDESPRSPPALSSPQTRAVPPPAPVLAAVEPAEPAVSTASTSAPAPAPKKAAGPPPVAAKSNAFRDRIAAFNQPAATPIAPIQPGRKTQTTDFIKKPFVAPPPSKNAFVPQPKVDIVQKPYHREEDPEIKQRQEEDRAAAAAAGLINEPGASSAHAEDEEDAPKPMTLKERMALLQQQQQEQAQRRAETSYKKKVPPAKPADVDHVGAEDAEDNEGEQLHAQREQRKSIDTPRTKPQVPLPQQGIPPLPDSEIVSDGHEADQSGAGDVTEDDSGTLGADDSEERSPEAQRYGSSHHAEPDVRDEDDTTERDVPGREEEEEEEEDSMDEEEKRKLALRQRMARLGGTQPGMGVMLGFGGPPPPPPTKKKSSTQERRSSEDTEQRVEPQRVPMVPMVPMPGLPRMQSPEADNMARDDDEQDSEEDVPAPPKRASTSDRGAPPPIPRGKLNV